MPTPISALIPGHPVHLIQRAVGSAACFLREGDRLAYLCGLARYAEEVGCAVHAYVLMRSHLHLLLTPSRIDGAFLLMRAANDCYTRYMRDSHGISSSPWERGLEVSPVYVRRYVLGCMRYIELNPVRAGVVHRPGDYRWSSFRANALGKEDDLVTAHPFYYALGRSAALRQAAYRALFRRRTAWATNLPWAVKPL